MLKTDDCDIQESYMQTILGGNGDYYILIKEKKQKGDEEYWEVNSVRISTSGGNAPTEVKCAAAELYRAMKKHNLNEHDID